MANLEGSSGGNKLGKIATTAIATSMMAGLAQADNHVSWNEWAQVNPDEAAQILANNANTNLVAQQLHSRQQTDSILNSSRSSKRNLQDEVGTIPDSFYVGGNVAGGSSELNASYVNGRFGIGAQLNRSEFGGTDIEQKSFTVVAKLTPAEESAFASFIEDVEVKGTITNSVVEGVIPFDEEAKVVEFTVNLRTAILKQVALSYGQHEVTVTGGAADWQQFNTFTDLDTQFISNPFQNREITRATTTNQFEKYNGGKVNTIGITALLQFGENLDVGLVYTNDLDSNGNNDDLMGINANYSLQGKTLFNQPLDDYSLFSDFRKTNQYTGNQSQNVGTIGGRWGKDIGQRSGISIDLAVQNRDGDADGKIYFQYRWDLKSTPDTPRNRLRSNIVTPATGALETNAHLINRDTREDVSVTVSEKVDNFTDSGLSRLDRTPTSLTIGYRLVDEDDDTIGGLSFSVNGVVYSIDADGKGIITVKGLTPDTSYSVVISGNVTNGITGATNFASRQATYKTLPEVVVNPDPEIPDEQAPEIELNGDSTITLTVGDTFTDPGATCTDDVDSSCEVVTSGDVDTSIEGTYTLTYTSVDAAGNEATPVERTVIVEAEVIPDTEAPVITVDTTPITLTVGDTFIAPTATCLDNIDATCDVVVTDNVNTSTAGSYTVTFSATDEAGNNAEIIVPVTVEAAPDTEAPTGENKTVSALNSSNATGSVNVTDDKDPNPSIQIISQGSHGTLSFSGNSFAYTGTDDGYVGSDSITYQAEDNSSNKSSIYTITVNDLAIDL